MQKNGVNARKITAFALGALQNINAVTEDGEPPRWAWLFNTPIRHRTRAHCMCAHRALSW